MKKIVKKLEDYIIQARCNLLVSITIPANNLEEAVTKSKEYKEEDFVTIADEYLDGEFEITGVYKSNA